MTRAVVNMFLIFVLFCHILRILTCCDAISIEMNVEFFEKLNEFLFAVITIKSTRKEDCVSVYNGHIPTWISLAVKILDSDEFFLEGVLKLCISGMKIPFQ